MSTKIEDKDYLLLNYDRSPVVITTRHENITVKPGADNNPSMVPVELSDIEYINHTTSLFKIGMLWFEPEVENQMYEHLRIRDYDSILTNQEIEDIILHPTADKLERVLAIEDPMYFARVHGVYVGLKNAGASISMDIANLISARLSEFRDRKWKTSIKVKVDQPEEDHSSEINALKKQLEDQNAMMQRMQEMVEKLTGMANDSAVEVSKEQASTQPPKKATTKRPVKDSTAAKET